MLTLPHADRARTVYVQGWLVGADAGPPEAEAPREDAGRARARRAVRAHCPHDAGERRTNARVGSPGSEPPGESSDPARPRVPAHPHNPVGRREIPGRQPLGLVPFELAARPGTGARSFSGPAAPDIEAGFALAAWAVDLCLTRAGLGRPGCDLHLHLPLLEVVGTGPSCRLALANAILQVRGAGRGPDPRTTVVLGDLTLDGDVLPVGALAPTVAVARAQGFDRFVVPMGSGELGTGVVEAATLAGVRTGTP
jgi:hypothetical protein